jgi:hypothetical protein
LAEVPAQVTDEGEVADAAEAPPMRPMGNRRRATTSIDVDYR